MGLVTIEEFAGALFAFVAIRRTKQHFFFALSNFIRYCDCLPQHAEAN
jgi:hypothetical protein